MVILVARIQHLLDLYKSPILEKLKMCPKATGAFRKLFRKTLSSWIQLVITWTPLLLFVVKGNTEEVYCCFPPGHFYSTSQSSLQPWDLYGHLLPNTNEIQSCLYVGIPNYHQVISFIWEKREFSRHDWRLIILTIFNFKSIWKLGQIYFLAWFYPQLTKYNP